MADKALMLRDEMPLTELGAILAKSGFFADTRDAGQAIVKVLAGKELGLGAIAAMTGIYIVKGRVSLSANLMAALVKRSGKYNYRVVEHTAAACEIAFFEGGEEVGRSRFTAEDARKAGTQNMDKYAKNMLFARAMSNGVKWFCPDVTGGPAYTPEEMGAREDGEGNVIEVTPEPVKASQGTNGNGHAEAPSKPVEIYPPNFEHHTSELLETKLPTSNTPEPAPSPSRPFAPEVLKAKLETTSRKNAGRAASPAQRGLLVATLEYCYPGDGAAESRHLALDYLTGEQSSKKVPDAFVLSLLDWLKPAKDDSGAWVPDGMAEREAALVLRQARLAAGQVELLPA
jgi:hypothetical protein